MSDVTMRPTRADAFVIGAGPAGLMAAEVLVQAGFFVQVFDAMPSAGRKFLLAGIGGLNLTHSEPKRAFVSRYGKRQAVFESLLETFDADESRAWAKALGVDTFVGTSGRVFPAQMKAAPLLRAWLHRLREAGVVFHMRHRWCGWRESGALLFDTHMRRPSETVSAGEREGSTRIELAAPKALVLALGGASWPQLGSDAAWVPWLRERGVPVAELKPANCGFEVNWSPYFSQHFAGRPIKPVTLRCDTASTAPWVRQGELVVSSYGIEGSLIYAASALLREQIAENGVATIELDLAPHRTVANLAIALAQVRGKRSIASHWRSRLGLEGVAANLVREFAPAEMLNDSARLAQFIKRVPIQLTAPRPIAEAISSAGGVPFEALTDGLMVRTLPGVFCAGEMLDWEAPTGGYLLTGCFATGRTAGLAAADWLNAIHPI